MKKWIAVLLVFTLFLVGCGGDSTTTTSHNPQIPPAAAPTLFVDTSFAKEPVEMFTGRDLQSNYVESQSTLVTFSDAGATANNSSVIVSGKTATITTGGTYILSGTVTDGALIVQANPTDKVQLVLRGLSVTASTTAPICILEADKVVVTLADGTQNILSNTGGFSTAPNIEVDAALFSMADLSLNGNGYLTVNAPTGKGISSKDDLVFTGGNYVITSGGHGLDANNSIRIQNTAMTITAGKDAIHSEHLTDAAKGFVYIVNGSYTITAAQDGISASAYLLVKDGNFAIKSGGGSSNGTHGSSSIRMSGKGLKSAQTVLLEAGTYDINSADDAIHADANVCVRGGSYNIKSGDDGLHAGKIVQVLAGQLQIPTCYEGVEGLAVDLVGGAIHITSSRDGINVGGGTDGSTAAVVDPITQTPSDTNGNLYIAGGEVGISAENDCIDVNGSIVITGGTVILCATTATNTPVLDYDVSATITGGTFLATGLYQNAIQPFSATSTQGVVMVTLGRQNSHTALTITDSAGTALISHTPIYSYQTVVFSAPSVVKGATYTVNAKGAAAQ